MLRAEKSPSRKDAPSVLPSFCGFANANAPLSTSVTRAISDSSVLMCLGVIFTGSAGNEGQLIAPQDITSAAFVSLHLICLSSDIEPTFLRFNEDGLPKENCPLLIVRTHFSRMPWRFTAFKSTVVLPIQQRLSMALQHTKYIR